MSTDWKNNVIRNFDNKSITYDKYCKTQQIIAKSLATDLPNKNIYTILEIGCGTGNLTHHLLNIYKNKNLCITDISLSMLEQAQGKFSNKNIEWKIFDGENKISPLPLVGRNDKGGKKYDLIVANMVFQWFEDIESSLNKLSQMLKPKGSIFYSIPSSNSFKEWKTTLQNLNLPIGILDFQTHNSIYRQEEIEISYENAFGFLHSMKDIGAGLPRKNYTPLNPKQLKQACNDFDKTHKGKITWHILYGRIDNND